MAAASPGGEDETPENVADSMQRPQECAPENEIRKLSRAALRESMDELHATRRTFGVAVSSAWRGFRAGAEEKLGVEVNVNDPALRELFGYLLHTEELLNQLRVQGEALIRGAQISSDGPPLMALSPRSGTPSAKTGSLAAASRASLGGASNATDLANDLNTFANTDKYGRPTGTSSPSSALKPAGSVDAGLVKDAAWDTFSTSPNAGVGGSARYRLVSRLEEEVFKPIAARLDQHFVLRHRLRERENYRRDMEECLKEIGVQQRSGRRYVPSNGLQQMVPSGLQVPPEECLKEIQAKVLALDVDALARLLEIKRGAGTVAAELGNKLAAIARDFFATLAVQWAPVATAMGATELPRFRKSCASDTPPPIKEVPVSGGSLSNVCPDGQEDEDVPSKTSPFLMQSTETCRETDTEDATEHPNANAAADVAAEVPSSGGLDRSQVEVGINACDAARETSVGSSRYNNDSKGLDRSQLKVGANTCDAAHAPLNGMVDQSNMGQEQGPRLDEHSKAASADCRFDNDDFCDEPVHADEHARETSVDSSNFDNESKVVYPPSEVANPSDISGGSNGGNWHEVASDVSENEFGDVTHKESSGSRDNAAHGDFQVGNQVARSPCEIAGDVTHKESSGSRDNAAHGDSQVDNQVARSPCDIAGDVTHKESSGSRDDAAHGDPQVGNEVARTSCDIAGGVAHRDGSGSRDNAAHGDFQSQEADHDALDPPHDIAGDFALGSNNENRTEGAEVFDDAVNHNNSILTQPAGETCSGDTVHNDSCEDVLPDAVCDDACEGVLKTISAEATQGDSREVVHESITDAPIASAHEGIGAHDGSTEPIAAVAASASAHEGSTDATTTDATTVGANEGSAGAIATDDAAVAEGAEPMGSEAPQVGSCEDGVGEVFSKQCTSNTSLLDNLPGVSLEHTESVLGDAANFLASLEASVPSAGESTPARPATTVNLLDMTPPQ